MSKKPLFIGAIASIIAINSVFADTTVTSKTYVDTTRQATIPVAGTNASTPGSAVVTYTDTAGTIGERGICDAAADGNDDCDNNYLVTRDLLSDATDLPETTVTYKTCYQEVNGDCILWNLSDKDVYGKCRNDDDCAWLDCTNNPNGQYYHCFAGRCSCGGGK